MTKTELKKISINYFKEYPDVNRFYAVNTGIFWVDTNFNSAKYFASINSTELITFDREVEIKKSTKSTKSKTKTTTTKTNK